jgi:FkbM family methyltransferase
VAIKLYLPTGVFDLIEQDILQNRSFFHYESLEMTRQYIQMRGDVVLDIGAYLGNHTVYYYKICGAAKIHCFEPLPSSFHALARNVQINNVDAVLHNCGLGSTHHQARAAINFRNFGGTSLISDEDGPITIKPLDSCNLPRFTFMKIDVEGMAPEVLLGGRETILKYKPNIVVEAFPPEFDRVDGILQGLGYAKQAQTADDFVYFPR